MEDEKQFDAKPNVLQLGKYTLYFVYYIYIVYCNDKLWLSLIVSRTRNFYSILASFTYID